MRRAAAESYMASAEDADDKKDAAMFRRCAREHLKQIKMNE